MLLVRHAWAGARREWHADDEVRPLDDRGRRQADALVDLLAEHEVTRIVSSPYARCVATIEPLARARGLSVESRRELGKKLQDALGESFLREIAGEGVVACVHGGIEDSLGLDPFKKGCVWVLGPALEPGRYMPPPA
jgi:8-oxo-dGTP diphosphatase